MRSPRSSQGNLDGWRPLLGRPDWLWKLILKEESRPATLSDLGATRSDGNADMSIDMAALSPAYLGAVTWRDLATIGAVTPPDDVIGRLDSLFAVRPTPFCGTGY